MTAIPIKLRFGRLLNYSGSAGTRRLLIIGGLVVVLLGGGAYSLLKTRHVEQATTLARAPSVDPLPGGPHTTPAYTELANKADQQRGAAAALAQRSSVATMPGRSSFTQAAPPDETPAVETVQPLPAPKAVIAPRVAAATPRSEAAPPVAAAAAAPATTNKRQPEDDQAKFYQAAIGSVLAGWGDKPQQTEVILQPSEREADTDRPATSGEAAPVATRTGPQSRGGTVPVAPARLLNAGLGNSRVLMPAGRGVYARTILAASSDQGGPVVLEASSGPIAGNRMTGTFETRDTRMVVRVTSITLRDGTQQKIDALVVSPDTLETSVASSVDQHYVTRFVLPVAAAFVSGLGQAIAQSNSTIVAGPLGGATAFQKLNLDQQLGVAAGSAANQFGAAVTAAAPKGPTVNLEANVNVGVMFLEPLIVPN